MDMFEQKSDERKDLEAPLATRMRPATFSDFVGQEHLIGNGRVLRKAIETDKIPSVILWGPPGSGKTTLAYIIADATESHFSPISAVNAGVADLRRIIEEAKDRHKALQQQTILFIDEIHRFNKAQQDAVLPYVEDGTVVLIGATTENPSFEVISALISRCQVLTLNPLTDDEIHLIVLRALKDTIRGLGALNIELDEDALHHLITVSNNDARVALNGLEMAALATPPDADGKRRISLATIEDAIQHRALRYDKDGEHHYNTVSALHKSMRGSDPDASLYWLARMLEAGEDPLYIARRLVRFASEDVGMPEGNLALAEAAVYLATTTKSNSLYQAYSRVQEEVRQSSNEPVPLHLRNPVTPLMKEAGYGKGYKYAHDYPGHFVEQQNLPDSLQGKRYYTPSDQGYEKKIIDRLKAWWRDFGKPPEAKETGDD